MSADGQAHGSGNGLLEQVQAAYAGTAELIAIHAGYRYHWYACLAEHGPMTAEELSTRTATGPRFTEEWTRQQTAVGILAADLSTRPPTFRLPSEAAAVLLGEDGTDKPTLARALAEACAMFVGRADRLVSAWQHDRSGYIDADEPDRAWLQAMFTGLSAGDLPGQLAAVAEVAAVLGRRPLRVADLGCGAGLHIDAMAAAWPDAHLAGYDLSQAALDLAAQRPRRPGVTFRPADAVSVVDCGPFDLILVIDALHDMPDPAAVLTAARRELSPGGVIVVAETPYPPEFAGTCDPAERLGYMTSLFNCLHMQIGHSGRAAVGAVVRESQLIQWGRQAALALRATHDTGADLRMSVFGPRSASLTAG
ncbi:methyltransferase family protein [Micromonospora kangleipakensis]|uniref:Methyltransferase family protein n=1 Tax=Micromonospora kangleipakensis TaxID=1077942 RepID=A0A4Q8BCU9_9ACTN|nr:class I SAM-dependent methyltransferase [Micromonospora kangleipakensis]RZU74973.1 methyltransferase family protein [Micromonospora kangleipakensis]